jgi:signal transduction histidine kinase
LIATCACIVGADFFFFSPSYSLRIGEPEGRLELVLFAIVSLLINVLVEMLIRAREAAHRERAEAAALAEIATKAQREAERASKAKDEFMAMVSHELRSPLHVIVSGIQILKQKQHHPGNDASFIFEMIERSAKTETRLIEDLLDTCRCSVGKMSLQRQVSRIRGVIETTIASMQPDLETKGLNVSFKMLGPDNEVYVDTQRVQQIATNLLNNAIKFTDPGGWISVELDERDVSSIELRVSDSGIGIAQELQEEMFEPFRQGEGADSKGGLGLGLAIVKDLVTLHGGTVHVQSEGLHCGTTFTVRFPIF